MKKEWLGIVMALAVMTTACAATEIENASTNKETTVVETTIVETTVPVEMTADEIKVDETTSEAEETENEETTVEESTAEETEAEETTQAEMAIPKTSEIPHSGFVFIVGDTYIGMNEDVETILSELGMWTNYAETTSCAFKGLDKTYSYPGFDLYTYPLNGRDNVNSVYFVDESVKTVEGIGIGSSQEDMERVYGTDYTEEFGVYTYTKDKSTLQFIITDGVIEAIEYTAITPE